MNETQSTRRTTCQKKKKKKKYGLFLQMSRLFTNKQPKLFLSFRLVDCART